MHLKSDNRIGWFKAGQNFGHTADTYTVSLFAFQSLRCVLWMPLCSIRLMKENDLHLFKWSAFELHKTEDVLQCVSVCGFLSFFLSISHNVWDHLLSLNLLWYIHKSQWTVNGKGRRQQWRCQLHYMDSLMVTKLWMNCLKCEMHFIIIIIIITASDRSIVCVCVCVLQAKNW